MNANQRLLVARSARPSNAPSRQQLAVAGSLEGKPPTSALKRLTKAWFCRHAFNTLQLVFPRARLVSNFRVHFSRLAEFLPLRYPDQKALQSRQIEATQPARERRRFLQVLFSVRSRRALRYRSLGSRTYSSLSRENLSSKLWPSSSCVAGAAILPYARWFTEICGWGDVWRHVRAWASVWGQEQRFQYAGSATALQSAIGGEKLKVHSAKPAFLGFVVNAFNSRKHSGGLCPTHKEPTAQESDLS